MSKYLDDNGLIYFWQKIKALFTVKSDSIKNITRSGTTFTATRADGTTFTFTQQDNTVAKTTTTPLEDGTAAIGSENKYAAGNHVHPHDSTKVDKVTGKDLSTNDYTDADQAEVEYLYERFAIDGFNPQNLSEYESAIPTDYDFGSHFITYRSGLISTEDGITFSVVAPGFEERAGAWLGLEFDITEFAFDSTHPLKVNVNGAGARLVKRDGMTNVSYDFFVPAEGSSVPGMGYVILILDKTQPFTYWRLLPMSSNDFTSAYKSKLNALPSSANNSDVAYDSTNKKLTKTVNGTTSDVVTLAQLKSDIGNASGTKDGLMGSYEYGCVQNLTASTMDGLFMINDSAIEALDSVHYAVCSTSAATAAKTVTKTLFKLVTGAWIAVKFSVTNTAAVASLTLQVGSTTAKPIKYRGSNLSSAGVLASGRTYLFVYDGTNWEIVGDLDTNTTYTNMTQSEATTGTATTARSISAKVLNDTIDAKIAASQTGSSMYKGKANAETDISSTSYKVGWYWVVGTAGTYFSQVCEVGDMIFANTDKGSTVAATDFDIIQSNIITITNAEIDTILAS